MCGTSAEWVSVNSIFIFIFQNYEFLCTGLRQRCVQLLSDYLISVNSTSIFILQNYEFPCTAVRRWTIWNRMSCRVTRIDFDLIVWDETHPSLRPSAFHQGRATNWLDVIDLNYGNISWLYSSCIGRRLLDDIDFLHSATSNTSEKKQTE